MHLAAKLTFPLACVSLLLGACSSSGGASPLEEDFGSAASPTISDSTGGSATPADVESGVEGSVVGTADSTISESVENVESVASIGIVGADSIPELQGEWTTGCLPLSSTSFRSETISVVGFRMLWTSADFDDQECTNPILLSGVLSGSTIQSTITTVPTGGTVDAMLGLAKEVNFHFDDSTVDNRPLPDEPFFGRENYLARIEYNIVLVDGGNLYFGDTSIQGFDGTSPETRPASLDTIRQFFPAQ